MAKQLTIRGVPDDVSDRLEKLSRQRGQSVNAMVNAILENAVGVNARRARLERYATWTADDLAEFEGIVRAQRSIDDELWR